MFRQKKFWIIAVCVLAVAAVAVIVCLSLNNNHNQVSLEFHGTALNASGQTGDPFDFTVSGKIQVFEDEPDQLDLTFAFPDDFRYAAPSPDPEAIYDADQFSNIPYYTWTDFCYNKELNAFTVGIFALDLEKGCFIAKWDMKSDEYLVASTDPNMTPQQIKDHFQDFLDMYCRED